MTLEQPERDDPMRGPGVSMPAGSPGEPVAAGGGTGGQVPASGGARGQMRASGGAGGQAPASGGVGGQPPASGGAGGQVPAWRTAVKASRLVVVRPSPFGVGSAFVGAACVALAVVVYGASQVDVLWSVLAGLAGVGVFVLTLRGFPLLAVVALALSAFLWGLAMRAWLPASATDLVGDLRFTGGNLAFVVPLAGAFLLAIALDAHRVSRAAIDEALSGRRWWGGTEAGAGPLRGGAEAGAGSVHGGAEAGAGSLHGGADAGAGPLHGGAEVGAGLLRELEVLPAARFFALAEGPCTHLVSVSRRVALVLPVAWPEGGYAVDADGRVLRDGHVDEGASADLDGLVAALEAWQERLQGTGATLRGFLVVSPATGREVLLDVAAGQHIHIVHGQEFAGAAGGWLAAEPYRIDLAVTERLLSILGEPSADPAPAGAPPGRRAPAGRRRARAARGAAGRSGTPGTAGEGQARTSPSSPAGSGAAVTAGAMAPVGSGAGATTGGNAPVGSGAAATVGGIAPGWDAESAQRLADWAATPPPDTTEWWKDPADPPRPARRGES